MNTHKLLMLPIVIVGDFFESCHMAEKEDYRYIIDVFQGWAGSTPCWKTRDVPEFTEFDTKLMHVFGVLI